MQEEYYVTHQCFLTNRGLYLLVWNVKDGQPGIESLEIWLQNLQVSIVYHAQWDVVLQMYCLLLHGLLYNLTGCGKEEIVKILLPNFVRKKVAVFVLILSALA